MKFYLNVDQVHKLNNYLPKGYKLVTTEDYKKKIAKPKKKNKITYVPLNEVIPPVAPPPPVNNTRKKPPISYKEEDILIKQQPYEEVVEYKIKKQPTIIPKMPEYFPPPIKTPIEFEVPEDKEPLTTKEIIGKLKENENFFVIIEYRDLETIDSAFFDRIVAKTDSSSYSLLEFQQDLTKLFLKMYAFYPRTSPQYLTVSKLEGFLINLIKHEKNKTREVLKQQKIKEQPVVFPLPEIGRQSSTGPTINRKKPPFSRDTKSITIMDKRILGQNIKKLPSDYLPQICRIVFDTLETREEYVIDIDTLPLKKVRQLQIYVDDCMQKMGQIDLQNTLRNENDSEESSFIITDDFD